MQTIRFTQANLDALPAAAKGKRDEYRDESNPALLARVSDKGVKVFVAYGWSRARQQPTRVTLGTYRRPGDPRPRMPIERARRLAASTLAELAAGNDPNLQARVARAKSITLRDALADYLDTKKNLKARTRADYAAVISEAAADWLTLPLSAITPDLVLRRHAKHGKRSPARADNFARVLRAIWTFHNASGQLGENPVRVLQSKGAWHGVKRKRTRIREKQLPAWWEAVTGLRGQRSDSGADVAGDLLLFLLLTGLRAGEACGLRWEFVDLRELTIEIPDPKNREPHLLPLTTQLEAIFQRRAAAKTGPFVFGSKHVPRVPYNYSTLRGWIEAIAAECGVRAPAHDLRRTFASIAEGMDVSGYTIKRLLNHRTGSRDVTADYIAPEPQRLRGALQRINDEIERQATTASDNVIQLRQFA